MGSQLFGPLDRKTNIKVGYIDPDNGFVDGLTVCQANEYARLNPGTVFIFKTGDSVLKYLNINEVNDLTSEDLIRNKTKNACAGVNQKIECGPPKIEITGGGGIGAVGNPIIGIDGSILAVDIVRTGHGYTFPPQVTANDECQYGTGSVLRAVLGELVIKGDELVIESEGSVSYDLKFRNTGSIRGYRGEGRTYLYQYYDRLEDYEEYELCEEDVISYGTIWGPNGEDLGDWIPQAFIGESDNIIRDIQEFERDVRSLEGGFFNTRKIKPSSIISSDPKVTGGWNHVNDKTFVEKQYGTATPPPGVNRWGDFMNAYAISPKPPSNVKGSDYAGILFTYLWNLEFPTTGDYIIRGAKDNIAKLYIDNEFISDLDGFKGEINDIKKFYQEGQHTVRLDIINKPIYETVPVSTKGGCPSTITFKVTTSAKYANSIEIPGLDINVGKEFDGNQLNETFNRDVQYGVEYDVIVKSPQSKDGIRLRTQGDSVLQLEEATDNDWQDLVCTVSCGRFIKINGNKCKLIFDAPPAPLPLKSNNIEIINTEVFNTVDWINKADRKLWRTNVYTKGGFINDYGISPFDTLLELKDNPYAGTHVIRWEHVEFPADGNYNIEVEVDDNVTLYIGNRDGDGAMMIGNGLRDINLGGDEVILEKKGFRSAGNSTGKSTYTRYFKKGRYRIRAELEQIPGGKFAFTGIKGSNPMALAVRITSAIAQATVISPRSWNDNPMGVALTIDAPDPIVPQQPPPVQEGRCPPNPIWSTRSSGAKEQWYPVIYDLWSTFTNRYAMSPVKPLSQPGTDSGGTVYVNSWTIDVPYDGYYGLKATVDNAGKISIDGEPVMQANYIPPELRNSKGGRGAELRSGIDGVGEGGLIYNWRENDPEAKKIFLSKGTHTIDVEVENGITITYNTVDRQVFNTQSWQQTGTGIKLENVNFKVTSSAGFANSVEMVGQFSFSKEYDGPQINESVSKELEVGKVYDVIFRSNKKGGVNNAGIKLRNRGDKIVEMEDYTDNDWQDIVVVADKGRFYDFNGGRCKYVLGAPVTQTTKTIGQVTYSGPELFHYTDKRWGDFLNKNGISPYLPPLDSDNPSIIGVKTYTWSNVNFPDDGQYTIFFQGDDNGSLFIDNIEVATIRSSGGTPTPTFVNLSKGNYTVRVELNNIKGYLDIFTENPAAFAVKITKKVKIAGPSKSWADNPMGISAALIAPPCPRRIDGKGIVTDVIVEDPGNGYLAPADGPEGYPVALRLKEVLVKNPGVNYNCGVDQLTITPNNSTVLDYRCGPFGQILEVNVVSGGIFTETPAITMPSDTGVNFEAVPLFEVIRDPLDVPQEQLIQVTDLVGLKQTGYVDGRAYYGAVFYKEGVRYAGYYETAGQLIQVYDTLQESINAQVTTAPSAIQRQGTDINSNNQRLDIPGTPDQLI